jgi:protein CpxP
MTTSGRNKILVILVIVLLLTNAGMLYYFTNCYSKKNEEKPISRAEWVANELKMDSAQFKTYISYRALRDSNIKVFQLDLRATKLDLLELLRQPTQSDSAVFAAIKNVTDHQQPIELEYFKHYQRMKKLLNADQMVVFDTLLVRMVRRNTGGDDNK